MNTIVYNDIIPAKGFKSIALLPFIFVRNGARFSGDDERHERTHLRQQLEMLVVGIIISVTLALCGSGWWSLSALPMFLYWYGIEWAVRFILYRNRKEAYKNISFEQEAYLNEGDVSYLYEREPFAWIKYLGKKTYKR